MLDLTRGEQDEDLAMWGHSREKVEDMINLVMACPLLNQDIATFFTIQSYWSQVSG